MSVSCPPPAWLRKRWSRSPWRNSRWRNSAATRPENSSETTRDTWSRFADSRAAMNLPIVKFPDPILQRPSAPVTAFDEELAQLVDDMFESMYAAHGIG